MRTQLSVNEVESQEGQQPQARPAPRTTVIIPVYNEEEGISVVLQKLAAVLDDSYEVLVVDDGSTDGTRQVALRFPCRVISHEVNWGKAEAIRTGVAAARGENVIFVDGDDTYPVEAIPRMASALNDYDMVVASRTWGNNHIPWLNRVGNTIFRSAINRLYGFRPYDPLTGLYGLKKAFLVKMRLESGGFCIEAEIAIKAARMGMNTVDMPVEYQRRVGEAKLQGLRDGYLIFQAILKMLGLYNPTLSFVLPGGALFTLGVIVMASLLVGNLSVGGFSLGVYSFILAAMLALAGFQLAVFGFALNLYGVAHKFTKRDALTRLFLRNHMGRNFALVGLALVGLGVGLGAWLGPSWLEGEVNSAIEAKRLVLTSFLGVFGLHAVVSSVFLSIFAREVTDTTPQVEAAWEVAHQPGGIAVVPQTLPDSGQHRRFRA